MEQEFLAISGLFKARPAEEGGRRILYIEASNEAVDMQGERVLAKSLRDSADYFSKYGNIDLDHRTLLPSRGLGDNPYLWEIGRPVEVTARGDATLVKAELYRGDGPVAANANMVWESMTGISPPARWFPSVGGAILERGSEIDPLTKSKVTIIKRVRWANIGLSRTPVNNAVPPVSIIEAEVFAKCLTAGGCLNLTKALAAGYGTDAAALNGGAALRTQSLDDELQEVLPLPAYSDVREFLAGEVRNRRSSISRKALAQAAASHFRLDHDTAAALSDRFLVDLHGRLP